LTELLIVKVLVLKTAISSIANTCVRSTLYVIMALS